MLWKALLPFRWGGDYFTALHLYAQPAAPAISEACHPTWPGWRVWPKTRGTLLPKIGGSLSGEH
jgi:hypothetical protein